MLGRRLALAAVLVLAACGAQSDTGADPGVASSDLITVEASSYGAITLATMPDARCTVSITTPLGKLSDGAPSSVSGQADAGGRLSLTYTAPRVPAGNGTHLVTCSGAKGTGSLQAGFVVPNGGLSAVRFTARVVASAVPSDEKSVREEPSLVPLRDAAVKKLSASLTTSWKEATRGLSTLELVPANADIVLKVVAGKAMSVHRTAPDTSEDILVYVADQSGEQYALENVVAVALHEIGHIWCCRGPGTVDGHWATQEESPGLLGVDRFGLMNHPVNCLVVPSGFLSCPNRFSDRELKSMGFENIPPPVADPCVLQRDALLGQLPALRTQLDQLAAQIKSIEAQYPSKVLPPDVYARYQSLVSQYNATRDRYNSLVTQRNALPC